MQVSSGEDLLEALFELGASEANPAEFLDLPRSVTLNTVQTRHELSLLESEGYLIICADGKIALTDKGRITGQRIRHKHKVLECFFTEMLGMEPDVASIEACTLEHNVSDETIDRLGEYIERPSTGTFEHRERIKRRSRKDWQGRSLLDFEEGSDVCILGVRCLGDYHRLADLGMLPGEVITLVRKLPNDAVVVRVKACDIALSPEIARYIFVE